MERVGGSVLPHAEVEHSARQAGYYIAGVYREKASGARADALLGGLDLE